MQWTPGEGIPPLFSKEAVTLLVTDSGLGGLLVFAQVAERLFRKPIFQKASLVYYNAWPEQNRGYNTLKGMQERVRVFQAALEGMKRYHPDLIMIACNTLSVLFPETPFSRTESIPVVDIVRFGVDMIYERLSRDDKARALLLGTVTTIASDRHRSLLIQRGISPERIVVQPCDQLATQIEKGPEREPVAALVKAYATEAAEKLGRPTGEVVVGLLCTHFGYCRDLIGRVLQEKIPGKVTLLDPNQRMAAFLFEKSGDLRCDSIALDLKVVSRIKWEQERIDAISNVIRHHSLETARALRHYQWIPDLFTV